LALGSGRVKDAGWHKNETPINNSTLAVLRLVLRAIRYHPWDGGGERAGTGAVGLEL